METRPPIRLDLNASPLTLSSLHLSFIFCLCFQIGRRRREDGEEGGRGPVPRTRSEAASSPHSL